MICADPDFGVTKEEVEKILDPINFVGRAPKQTEEFLDNLIEPLRKANAEFLGERVQLTV